MKLRAIIYFVITIYKNVCDGFKKNPYMIRRSLKHATFMTFIDDFYKIWEIDYNKRPNRPKSPIKVDNVDDLRSKIKEGYRVRDLDVRGNTQNYGNRSRIHHTDDIHPVVKTLYDRANNQIHGTPGNRTDSKKVAIAIEGGGMRGCVAAGMITALSHLGLDKSVDVVYGSSAGSMVGAYFISEQLPYEGPEVYYDVLTSAGKDFIDSQSILRSVGLGLFDFRFSSFVSLFTDRMGKPVLNLDYLLKTIVQRIKPLKWDVFIEKQVTNKQVLKVVASGLLSQQPVVLSYEEGNFKTLSELTNCMRASMLLPGIAGDITRLKDEQAMGNNIKKTYWREYSSRKESTLIYGSEPMSDALVFEPIPYRSAVKENCTHVLVLRTRADGISVTAKMGIAEKMIMSRFFGRKQGLPELVNWMHKQYHKLIYAEDILILNRANHDFSEIKASTEETVTYPATAIDLDTKAKLYTIALPEGIQEVSRMETSRSAIFNNVRFGFAAAYDALVLDPSLRGKGLDVAKEIWPDSILDNNVTSTVIIESTEKPQQQQQQQQSEEKETECTKDVLHKVLMATPALKLPSGKREALVR